MIHPAFKINGKHYTNSDLLVAVESNKGLFLEEVANFFKDWLSTKSSIAVQTSGSTGVPKIIHIKKEYMVNSAIATGNYFGLTPGNSVLHCLPTAFIAGKMMLVRALVLGLEIDTIAPSSNPLDANNNAYDFSAMVPLQLEQSIAKLDRIKTLIVGGAAVSEGLINRIQNIKTAVYATYGMTETVTHIALKKINNSREDYFSILPAVKISIDDRGCLVIAAATLNDEIVVTNDMVRLVSKNEFQLLGRYDTVINSGGVKIIPEQVEQKLKNTIKNRFIITSIKDSVLGEKVVLIVEGDKQELNSLTFEGLKKFEKPKMIYFLPNFIETETGKINRKKTKALL